MNGVLLAELRAQVVEAGLEALRRGIVHGTAGNFSIRDRESGLIAISPSGIPYPKTTPADVVVVDDDANVVDGHRKPSSETPMHTMIMKAHPEVRAIVHTHSHYSTVVGTIREFLPPILTEVCCVVGERVPVARYGLTALPDIGLRQRSRRQWRPRAGACAGGADPRYARAVFRVVRPAEVTQRQSWQTTLRRFERLC
jgi:ribulose-5-phosphate 4-epimerase/fuculose-1-phosphate aldolase